MCGYGTLTRAWEDISFKLSCELGLDWASDNYGDFIMISGGTVKQYRDYYQQLKERLQPYAKWVKL